MKKWMHRIEVIVDSLIPWCLLLLFFVIIGEIFYYEELKPHHHYIEIIDLAIISVFVIDLYFKYIRAKNFENFLRTSWLDIIAVIPAVIVLRLMEAFVTITRIELLTQPIHGALEASAKWNIIVREVEEAGKISRLAIAHRFIQPLARAPRFLKALTFFEKPTGHPRQHGHKV